MRRSLRFGTEGLYAGVPAINKQYRDKKSANTLELQIKTMNTNQCNESAHIFYQM
jgi:hypothetical protein